MYFNLCQGSNDKSAQQTKFAASIHSLDFDREELVIDGTIISGEFCLLDKLAVHIK